MRTYVWNLTDLFDDNRLESLTATFLQIIITGLVVYDPDQASAGRRRPRLPGFSNSFTPS